MNYFSYRSVNVASAAACGLLGLFALVYLQGHLGLEPCYLCVTQRFFVIGCGLLFALAAIHNPALIGRRWYAGGSCVTAMGGSYFAMKQLWLQGLSANQIPTCGPPVDYLFEAFSTFEVIAMLVRGDGNCAETQWQFLGLSIPAWVLVNCSLLLAVGLLQLLRKN